MLIPLAYSVTSKAEEVNPLNAYKKPLVLQWEVSHPRNTDQISLIFREKKVELVTNTSSYQKGKGVSLGRFESSLNHELKELKEQVGRYYAHLKQTIPLSHLIKDPRVQAKVDPHAPVLRISEEEIPSQHPYFKPLALNYLSGMGKRVDLCGMRHIQEDKKIHCPNGKKNSNQKRKQAKRKLQANHQKTQWDKSRQSFPKKLFNCVP